ncbi:unnamed protein product, partial [marine sediment metagenome]
SALGRMVIRLGKHFGFRTLNVVRRAEQVDELKSLGGDVVVPFDATNQEPETLNEEVMRATNKKGVPFAIDPVGGTTCAATVACLGPQGRMLVYGTLTEDPLTISPRTLMTPEASIEGFWLARWMPRQKLLTKLRLVRTITRLMRAGVLVSDVGASYPLESIADAVQEAETVGRNGKVLLRISEI